MATDSFRFWDAYYDALKFLGTNEERGEFVMALCSYVFDGEEPEFSSETAEFGFRLIRAQAKESKELAQKAREGGLKSGQMRKTKGVRKGVRKTLPNEKNREEANRSESSSLYTPDTDAGRGLRPAPAPMPDDAPPPE